MREPAAQAYLEQLRERTAALPDVKATSQVWLAPWSNLHMGANWMGRQYAGNHVDPQFLDTMGIRLVRGRNFRPGEDGVALVNEATARVLWPDQDAPRQNAAMGASAPDRDRRRRQRLDRLRGAARISGVLPAAIAKRRAGLRSAGPCLRLDRAMSSDVFRTSALSLDERLQPTVQVVTDSYDQEVEKATAALAVIGILGTVANLLSVIGLSRPRRLHRDAAHSRDRTAHRARSPPQPRCPRDSRPDEPSDRHRFRLRRARRGGCRQQSCAAASRRCPGSISTIRSHT